MAKQELVLYLSLTPEFGGTRFGPFEGFEVRLGSAQATNDITLPETLGVAPHHVKVMQQSGLGLILTPVDRTAPVYVWKDGANRPQQIVAPVAVRAGDSFALVTVDGPRFIVDMAPLPPEVVAEREAAKSPWNRKRPGMKDFAGEGKRQIWVSILTTGAGQFAQRVWTFFRTGAFLRPRNLFAMVGVMGGYIVAAGAWMNSMGLTDSLLETEDDLVECEAQLGLVGGGDQSIADFTYDYLAGKITGLTALGRDLKNDPALLSEVEAQASRLLSFSDDYYGNWLLAGRPGRGHVQKFIGIRENLAESAGDLTPEVAALLPYASLTLDTTKNLWATMRGSDGESVCLHGHMKLTWRQALRLGISPNLDFFIQGSPDDYQQSGSSEAREAFRRSAKAINFDANDILDGGGFKTKIETLNAQNHCVTLDSDDTRSRVSTVTNALVRHLGTDASWVAEPGEVGAVTGRLAKFYLADLSYANFKDSNQFSTLSGGVSGTLKENGKEGQWVLEQTARTIAKALVLPCEAVLSGDPLVTSTAAEIFGDDLPDALDCIILEWKLRKN